MKKTALLLGTMLAGCGVGATPVAGWNASIIGGKVDSGDSGVVLLYAQEPGADEGSLCTASVIAPTVLLTAAHCVSPEEVGAKAEFHVYLGSNVDKQVKTDWVDVKEVHHDEAFNTKDLGGGHDVGIVILKDPVSIAPLAYNRTAIADGDVGQAVRLVGYGLNNASTQKGAGQKRAVSTKLVDYDAKLLEIGDSTHETCNGDSGGPAFMDIDGVQTIVGVTSFGNKDCTDGGYDTRIDDYVSFIDSYVNAEGGGSTDSGETASSGHHRRR